MKVALLISGYLRTFKSNIENIEKLILNKFDQVDIYLHITKDEHEDDKYLNPSDIYENIRFIESKLNPVSLLLESNINLPNKIHSNFVNHWTKFYKLYQLSLINTKDSSKYDLIIKYRPDLNIISENPFDVEIKEGVVYIPSDSKIDRKKLNSPDDKFLCDALAFGSLTAMDMYFGIISTNNPSGEWEQAPETALYKYLTRWNIPYQLVDIDYQIVLSRCNVFGICGDSGSGKTKLGNILKLFFSNSFMLEGDRYHKWERGDENWNKYTHLNPDANFITKMNEDIFNLRVGNSIYQVDYDHKNGKFTEQELIEPKENTIVCGLHSLYGDSDHLYDIKIFIDTDEDLKVKWKIERDMRERGHSKETVLAQIAKRSKDYYDFILPQRDKSDLVINFTPNNDNISLTLHINKKYEIGPIVKTLIRKGVKYKLTFSEENFVSLIFEEYQNVRLFENEKIPVFNDFYDYITFVIFNLNLTLS